MIMPLNEVKLIASPNQAQEKSKAHGGTKKNKLATREASPRLIIKVKRLIEISDETIAT